MLDQDLDDLMEKFSQRAAADGDVSLDEINSLNAKILWFKSIMSKKMKIQEETTSELEKVKKEKEVERIKNKDKSLLLKMKINLINI